MIRARSIALAFMTALSATAAIPAQTPSPTPPDDVVRISTSLVQFDVTILDQNGRPITDIRPDEIEVYSNGKKQTLSSFSFISLPTQPGATPTKAADKTAIALPPAQLSTSAVRRTIAVIVDDLALSWESVNYTKRALREFVENDLRPGDLVAILRTGTSVGALQQFTNDKRLLLAAIDKLKYNPMGLGDISALARIEPNPLQVLSQSGALPGGAAADQMTATMFPPKEVTAIQGGGLSSVQYIVRGMKDLPGRKSALYFSDGFDLFDPGRNEMQTSSITMLAMRRVIEEANRAAVVFYPVDPRGLQVTTLFEASDNNQALGKSDLSSRVDSRRVKFRQSQEGAQYLADETGGHAIINTNDLGEALKRELGDQSYYLIAYAPDSDTFDATGKYNKLEIRVLRKGAAVRYRRGFFGYTDETKAKPKTAGGGQNYVAELRDALVSPFGANGINVRLNSLVGSNADRTPYVRSLLHINAHDLKFTDEKDGQKTCAFDILATSFGDNGQLVDQVGKRYSMTVTPDLYQKVLTDGLVYNFKFPVTKPGAYQYRVAVRDANTGQLGAASQFVQVPDIKKGALTLSSIALEDMSAAEFRTNSTATTDAMTDTAIRRIKVGRVYRYSLEIYNAGLDSQKHSSLQTKVRVFREGQMILDGAPKAYDPTGQTDVTHLRFFGGLSIGSQMEPGDYVLQVIVTDANKKGAIASQFVEFEVVP